MKLVIKTKAMKKILKTLRRGGASGEGTDALEKALSHKYIRRIPKKTGKGWYYIYAETFLKPLAALGAMFNFSKAKIDEDYEKNNIKKEYGADKKTFAAHILEYVTNKQKWDAFFSKKENRAKTEKPQKIPSVKKNTAGQGELGFDSGAKKSDNTLTLNRTLMRKIWGMYSGQEDKDGQRKKRKNSIGTERRGLSAGTQTVRVGGGEAAGNLNVPKAESGDNGGESLFLPFDTGERTGRDVRLTVKETKNIREACLELLKSKTDAQMTDEDRALLRQYEGAGGLGEADATTHGTLYEFYTPRNVVDKVWQLVDKYMPGRKNVLEPSAGIGRFAENRPLDKFILNELDDVSSRIAGILNPDAEIKQGAFQALFKPGKPYTGVKYDCVIGNPPYGAYAGLWKGKGEGAEHNRYEEYFIDRGLDTLRDGGIMAFVVPSGFLDGANDKIKAKIAEKGRLLEAWRLPNGTFNTTGVGTDIVIIRKEKGDAADFSGGKYFAGNSTHILGDVTERKNQFGKMQQYVALPQGETFDSVMDRIPVEAVPPVPVGEPTEKEAAQEKVEVKESEAEAHRNRSEAMLGNDNAAGHHNVDTAAEFNAKYNKHIAPEALPVWNATQWDGSIDTDSLDKNSRDYIEKSGNYVKQADGKWYDIVNFASGNIYDKLDKLENTKDSLSKAEYERQKAILQNALPAPKTVLDIEVSPLSAFAEKFETSETMSWRDAVSAAGSRKEGKKRFDYHAAVQEQARAKELEGTRKPLLDAFKHWIRDTSNDELALNSDVSKNDIVNYVNKTRVVAARSRDEAEKEANRAEAARTIKARREAAERLFNQFIREQLSADDQKRLAEQYNRQYNGTVAADITKIPVFLDGISREFKGQEFRANDSQMKGVSWTANQGNGIIAFDVGVGKTITAIMSAMNDIQMGRCKKPIIAVPKAVYKNWINEISQLFPNVKINALGNFGDVGTIKNADGTLNIEDGSLTLCTYEAFAKIGFKDETLNGDLRESFSEAISVLTESDAAAAENGSKRAQRKAAKDDEDIMTKVGKAARTGENWVNWEDTGFDHITVDEAHNFRNSFSRPKNVNEGEADEFKDVPSGSTSLRGLKLFAITQMIQKRNNGRNVHLLTATPFQNSPGEIYNMLSYVAREKLKEAGIENYHEFLTQFIELKSELSVDSKGNVTDKNVVKGFKNLGALQSLLNQYIMKIDGEDAGIIRPDKTEHIVELNPTAEQRDVVEKIRAYMESNPDPKEDPGATLRCLNALRQAALSPALVDGFEFLDGGGSIKIKNKDFVKSSPKMTFVCDTAAELYKQHPDKGQIIHLPQGVSHYPDVKKYLVSQGIPEDAIAFLAPEYLKSGDAGNDQKEEITRAFNDPENKIKIIIGSDTIKEGVNLNGNTIQTYECMLAWNPTDTQQLKGRSHRQGNKQGMVHITFPLMNDSVDSFMYQKHDEKGTRLDTLYNSKKDKIDVAGIDPEELKFALIKDPKKRADMQIKAETAELTQKQKIAESTSDKVFTMAGDYKNYAEENNQYKKSIEELKTALSVFKGKSDDQLKAEYEDLSDAELKKYGSISFWDSDVGGVSGKSMKEIREKYEKAVKDKVLDAQKTIQRNKGKMDTISNTLVRYGVPDAANMLKVENVRKMYSEQALSCKARITAIEGSRDQYIAQAAAQIKSEAKPGVSVDEAVRQNTKAVSGNLYSMDVVKERYKQTLSDLKKSLAVMGKSILLIKVRRTARRRINALR